MMVKRLLYSITSIFLFVLTSSNSAGEPVDSTLIWKAKAVECERLLYEGSLSGERYNEVLLLKADAYYKAGMEIEAAETLRRLKMYLLDDSQRAVVEERLSQKSLKNSETAFWLSFIPGAGLFYAGDFPEGVLTLGTSAAAAAWIALNISSGLYLTGFLGGGMVLYRFYFPSFEKAANSLLK